MYRHIVRLVGAIHHRLPPAALTKVLSKLKPTAHVSTVTPHTGCTHAMYNHIIHCRS